MATPTDLVQQLYVAYFNRPADVAGLNFWVNALNNGATIDQVSKSFNAATEYTAAYAGKSAENIVDTVYMNLFGRHAEGAGLDFWAPKIASGAISTADLVKTIAAGAVNADGTVNADGAALANKVLAAEAFTTEINAAGNEAERLAYASGTATVLAAAKGYLAGVTDAASLATAIANVHASAQTLVNAANPATTYTLTDGTDLINGVAGNDIIIADNSTLGAGDQINGGAGVDTLNYTRSDAVSTTVPAANITNVEILNLRNVGTGALSLDASTITGVTAINADRSTAAVTLTNVASGTAVGIIGNGTVVNGAVSVGYAATSATATINLSGGVNDPAGAADLTITTANTKVVLNSTGTANSLDTVALGGGATSLTINATTDFAVDSVISGVAANAALTVTGAGAVDLAVLDNAFVTVDASTSSGGLTATLGTGVTSFKGSTGADVITTAATTATGATIAAGTGTDTLVLAASNDITTAAKGAQYTGFEVLQSLQTTAFNASLIAGVTSVQTAAAGAGFTGLTAAQAANVSVQATQGVAGATALTYALADATGTTDVLGLNVKGSTASAKINATNVTVAGFETVNLAVNGGGSNVSFKADGVTAAQAGTDYDNFGFVASTSLKNVKITGAYAAALTVAGQTKLVTLDASANTAGVNLTTGGQTGALVVTATAAADIINVGTIGTGGSQSVDAGAGNDNIIGAQADIAAAVIKGGAGTDTLTITDAALTVADNSFVNVTGIEKLVLGATTGLTWTVGGYANAIATANGGVLDITDTSLASTGAVTIDGSGLGASNSLKVTLKDTAGTGAITITESAGADVIKISNVTSGGAITVGGGTAALASTAVKSVDLSGALFGAATITTGAGADIIKVGAGISSITAGKGADVVTLLASHTAVDTLVYAAGDSTQSSMDLVSNFVTNQDVLAIGTAGTYTSALTSAQLGVSGWTVTNGIAAKSGATLADFLVAATTASAVGSVAFSDGTNTYVVASEGSSATTDTVIELVGLTTATAIGSGAAANKIIVA